MYTYVISCLIIHRLSVDNHVDGCEEPTIFVLLTILEDRSSRNSSVNINADKLTSKIVINIKF